jgi:flagellar assembly protein FliH
MSTDAAFAPLTIPVLAETEQEHAALVAARARGYATGYANGRRVAAEEQATWLAAAEETRAAHETHAAEQVTALARALQAAAARLGEATVPVLSDVEGAVVEAAFELATAVVGVALADRLSAARAAVARALSGETAGAVAVVRLSPQDLALLESGEASADLLTAAGASPRLVADPALAPGDAVAELPAGWLDARVSSALARAKEALA